MTRTWQDLVGGLEVDRASVARLHDEVAPRLNHRVAERQAVQRRMGVEPAQAIEQGRPTKRDRRQLAEWQRWSASADGDEPG